MDELRCSNCGRLLAKAIVHNGYVESKCPKCGCLNKYKWYGEEKSIVGTTSGHRLESSNKEREV